MNASATLRPFVPPFAFDGFVVHDGNREPVAHLFYSEFLMRVHGGDIGKVLNQQQAIGDLLAAQLNQSCAVPKARKPKKEKR